MPDSAPPSEPDDLRPGLTYDIGPECPRDELQARLDAARARARMNPPALGPIRRNA